MPSHEDPYTAIQAYGLNEKPAEKTATLIWTQAEMIARLEGGAVVRAYGKNAAGGSSEYASLIVVARDGKKYVKSENDDETPDNLLSHPDCV